jgi:predicted transcriptional regulator
MAKAILMSIRKEHNKNIFDGIKRFEGRKTLPAIIPLGNHIDNTSTYNPSEYDVICYVYEPKTGGGCGKVVGHFVCDFAQTFHTAIASMKRVANALCVTEDFAKQYFNREKGYMLRVCVPQRYDKPKELSEFYIYCGDNPKCDGCAAHYFSNTECGKEDYCCSIIDGCKPLKRPPQSWCYVEKLKGE